MIRVFGSARSALMAITFGFGGACSVVLGTAVASPLIGFVALAGLVGAGIIALHPTLGLLIAAFVVPVERLGRFDNEELLAMHLVSPIRLVGVVALGSVLLRMLVRRLRLVLPVPILLYAGYIFLAALSYAWAEQPEAILGRVTTLLGDLLFLLLVVNGVRDWPLVQKMVLAWLLATVLIALYQVYDWHLGATESVYETEGLLQSRFSTTFDSITERATIGSVRRAFGTTGQGAVYGINLMLTVPFFLYFAKVPSNAWVRRVAAGALLLILYNMLLTNTRAVLLFGLLTLGLCALTRLVLVTPGRVLLGLVGAGTLLALAPESVWIRILDASNYTAEKAANIQSRFDIWKASLALVEEWWLTGVGVGNTTTLLRYMPVGHGDVDWAAPHNVFLQLLIELGVFGFALFVAFLGSVLVLARRTMIIYRADPATADRYWFLVACQISILIVVLFGVQVDVFHFSIKGWWLIAGLACVMHELAIRPALLPDGRAQRFGRSVRAAGQ